MKLVEVIASFDTAESTLNRTLELCSGAGKTAIRVKDVAGFAINRVLHAFLIEAVRLVEEGVASVEDIDTACRLGLGHPLGPFELMDATTSSLCVQAQRSCSRRTGSDFVQSRCSSSGFAPGWSAASRQRGGARLSAAEECRSIRA